MRAMTLQTYGLAPALEERPDPTPGPAQVLVRVRATSVNPVDWKQASGSIRLLMGAKFPFVPGYDLAGDVVAVGEGVTTFAVGDRVHTRLSGTAGGANAELAVAGLDVARPIPAGQGYAEAAAVPLAGMTALQGLRDNGKLQAGQRVLIIGASGGVGHLAVQIALTMGGVVTGVCSGRNAERVGSLGASVIDYTKANPYAGVAPFDLIYDCVGSAPGDFLPLLTPTGRFVSCMPTPAVFGSSALNLFRSRKVESVMLKSRAADLAELDALYAAGKLQVWIDSRFPFADLPKAWERSRSGRAVGKIVVEL